MLKGRGGEGGESFLRQKAGSFWCLRVFGFPYQGLYIDQQLLFHFSLLCFLIFSYDL